MARQAAVRADTAWHALSPEEAFARVRSTPQGLTGADGRQRLQRFGANRLPPPERRGALLRFLAQFNNVLIYVLVAAGTVTAVLQHWVDAGVIFGVVVINAAIGFLQEGKAERALEAIRNLLPQQAAALRDGRRVFLPAEFLVPGDVVLLQSGDKVPADLRLIQVRSLQIQEAALSGESVAVEKTVAPVAADAPLGDRRSVAYSGTMVTYGQGRGVVVATGRATEIGRISALLGRVEVLTTPLLRQLATFGRWLTGTTLAVAAVTFVFGVFVRDYAAAEMFLAAVGLAVAAIPEGLPAIVTITLAVGVQRMAARNAIIRRLPAVETLGAVTVICSDKTGTLTRNEMTVQSIATARDLLDVTGVGYDPVGSFLLDGSEVPAALRPLLHELAKGALLCSDATPRQTDDGWTVDGDPTEGALVIVAMKAGLDPDFENKAYPRTDVIPFESEHRYMATLHHDHEGNAFVYVKGAPERILDMSRAQRGHEGPEPVDLEYWGRRAEEIAARGQRLLALAVRDTPHERADLRFDDVEGGLVMLGLFGLADPPRQEAVDAVARCQAAGIRVKMITGDHAGTARAVARRIGLRNSDDVLSGSLLDLLNPEELTERALAVDVFARTSPEHKLRLVQALQAGGQVVSMTGDGVNDAPALKRADVGVAMGQKGTEAAREAAEIVLTDDNFASIAHAVEEGRTIYDNLRKAITFILPTNGGEAFIVIAAVALGRLLPITPVQILWVNMITAVTLALALAFEPAESDVMARSPRGAREPLLSGFLVWRIVFVSAILLAGTFGLFLWERANGASIELARTVAVNTLVMFEVFYLVNTRRLTASCLNAKALAGNTAVLVAVALALGFQILFTHAPPMQLLFETRDLSLPAWLRVVLVACSVFFLVELEKSLVRRRRAHRSAAAA